MPTQEGTLEKAATALASLLRPLEDALGPGEIRILLAELGLQFPPAFESNATLLAASGAAVQRAGEIPPLTAALATAVKDENIPQIIAKGIELANAVRVVIEEIGKVANTLKIAGAGMGIPDAELNQFADELPGRLIEYLVARSLEAAP